MNYLKKFEELDSRYDNFIKKYKKSDYISTSSVKQLNGVNISLKDFKSLEGKVNKNLEFIKNNDLELFNDYFTEIKDLYPSIDCSNYFSLKILPKGGKSSVNSLSSFDAFIGDVFVGTNIDVTDRIIKDIFNTKEKEIKEYSDRLEASKLKRPGSSGDFWIKYQLSRIKDVNFIDKCEISPILNLSINFNLRDEDYFLHNYYNEGEYSTYLEETKVKIKEARGVVEKMLNEITRTYLNSIGYSDVNFRISSRYSFYDYTSDIASMEITFTLP